MSELITLKLKTTFIDKILDLIKTQLIHRTTFSLGSACNKYFERVWLGEFWKFLHTWESLFHSMQDCGMLLDLKWWFGGVFEMDKEESYSLIHRR